MDVSLNIGRTIARERRRMGITQEELAGHLGVTKAAVSKWELTQSLPDVSLLPRIAAYFSLTLDELFDWRDELTEGESAALYAEVYALGERDLPAAYARLRELVAGHYSDANLLLMMASLLTTWAAGTEASQGPAAERDGADTREPSGAPDAAALAGEALRLLDRALDVATEPATLFLAQQQKATTLFQMERYEDAAALLEPLAKRQDAGAAVMLLASAYRKLGRVDDALDLLQAERLRAANLVLSSLVQEMGVRNDAAFARAAGRAARAVFGALGMSVANPWYLATEALEEAEVYRAAGEREGALCALGHAVDEVASVETTLPVTVDASLWDRLTDRLDPARAGEAWAAHKTRQADATATLMRQAVAGKVALPAWREFAGDDPCYQELVAAVQRLADGDNYED